MDVYDAEPSVIAQSSGTALNAIHRSRRPLLEGVTQTDAALGRRDERAVAGLDASCTSGLYSGDPGSGARLAKLGDTLNPDKGARELYQHFTVGGHAMLQQRLTFVEDTLRDPGGKHTPDMIWAVCCGMSSLTLRRNS